MLYIWPFFAFFSAPLLIPPAVSWASSIYTTLCAGTPAEKTSNQSTQKAPAKSTPDEVAKSPALRAFNFFIRRLSYITFLLGAAVLSVGIVKYNTIIHPFTLADNRHYMFYVFRYIIKRSPMIRFALVPVYMISARLVWNRLAGHATNYRGIGPPATYISRPCLTPTLYAYWDEVFMTQPKRPQAQNGQTNTSSDAANPNTATTPKQPPPAEALIDLSHPDSTSTTSPSTSTALLWLATTSLSLMTAPLVEPRYFILPWIFWRLLVPAWPTQYTPPARFGRIVGWLADISRRYDLTVALETVWFAAINLATFWVFVNKPFVWTAEDGTLLDGGRTQRFMW
jgi:alpha-1,2-glucosyltransferase